MIDAYPIIRRKFVWDPAWELGEMKLDAGCGVSTREGFIGLDMYDYGQPIIWNLHEGIPLPDNSCDEVFTQHCLEHVPDMIKVMASFWRVLKPGGKLTVIVPHKTARKALIPTHVRLLDEGTFSFFEEGSEFNEQRRHGEEKWKIEEMVVNHRPDLVVIMTPLK